VLEAWKNFIRTGEKSFAPEKYFTPNNRGPAMTTNPQKHHRRSIRLKGYDYTQPGAYFVTIVTHDRDVYLVKS
jgi:hypothetical protein